MNLTSCLAVQDIILPDKSGIAFAMPLGPQLAAASIVELQGKLQLPRGITGTGRGDHPEGIIHWIDCARRTWSLDWPGFEALEICTDV